MRIICGRFEGVDERVIEARQLREISIGDFVLAGGDIAAMAVIETCVRLLPGPPELVDAIRDRTDGRGPVAAGHPTQSSMEAAGGRPPVSAAITASKRPVALPMAISSDCARCSTTRRRSTGAVTARMTSAPTNQIGQVRQMTAQ